MDVTREEAKPTGAGEPVLVAPPRRRPRWPLLLLLLVLIGVASPVAWRWYVVLRDTESTDNAALQGNVTQISSRINGTVVKVAVEDNQRASAGQVLVELDPTDYEIALAQAKAALALAQRQSRRRRRASAIARRSPARRQRRRRARCCWPTRPSPWPRLAWKPRRAASSPLRPG